MAREVEIPEVASMRVDATNPAAIIDRLATIEDDMAVLAPQFANAAAKHIEYESKIKREKLLLWSKIPEMKLKADKDARLQEILEREHRDLLDNAIAAEAHYEAWKVMWNNLDARRSIMQTLLNQHKNQARGEYGQGSHPH
jgi:hypothetical protein